MATSPAPAMPRPTVVTLHALFLLSGVSGLVYQLVWIRQFGNVFGNTLHSASLVTAIFMGGLGVGGYLGGLFADRVAHHRRGTLVAAYATAELCIGLWGLGLAAALPRLGAVSAFFSSYAVDGQGWHHLSAGSVVARGALAAALLTPPTLMMGATLTVLLRAVLAGPSAPSGLRTGALYGINTLGAALGSLATDTLLVPRAGLLGAQSVAVVLNLLAGLGALRISSALNLAPGEPQAPAPGDAGMDVSRREMFRICAAIALSGAAAMGAEMAWFRYLSHLLGSTRLVFSILLAVILGGMWLGATLAGAAHRRWGRADFLYATSQAVFAVATLASLWAVGSQDVPSSAGGPANTWHNALGPAWPALLLAGLPSVAMGCAYPLANAAVQRREGNAGKRAGQVYLANTVGAVAGSLLAGFVLLPGVGMQRTVTVLVGCSVGALVLLAVGASAGVAPPRFRLLRGVPVAAAAAALLLWMRLPDNTLLLKGFWHFDLQPGQILSLAEDGRDAVITTDVPGLGRQLLTNGHAMSSTEISSQRYMRAMAHVPLLSMAQPRTALIICFGVGNTSHAVALHPEMSSIDIVDISETVLRQGHNFAATNHDVLLDPRVRVFINDGRQHLRMTETNYDLITLEPPPLVFAGVSSLYSREFYQLARGRLAPGGYLTQWLPAYQLPDLESRAVVRAFLEVFPNAVLLSGSLAELILVGSTADRVELDPGRARARMEASAPLRADLERIGLGTMTELAGMFVAAPATLEDVTQGIQPMEDDRPGMEYVDENGGLPHRVVADYFHVEGVAEWCPGCRGTSPGDDLSHLPGYLAVMASIYRSAQFLNDSNQAATLAIPDHAAARAAFQDSEYLRTLVRRPSTP